MEWYFMPHSFSSYASLSRTWSFWGIAVACDNLMAGYRAQTLLDLGYNE